MQLRLVDAHDIEVAEGATGELVIRMDEPWTTSHGYQNDAAATARAWRNGWFHTGDLFRRDAAGLYYFIDRATDSIRRRGENISAFEVEHGLRRHPAIAEAAAVAVPAPGGSEQEVMAVIRLNPGAALEPAALLAFLRPHLAPHMLPRYVRFVADFPRTPTQKIEKYKLRAAGITPDSWDRDSAGVRGAARPAGEARMSGHRQPPGPLAGLRVLEFAAIGPVPFCGMLLSDMGADVLRIDRPGAQYDRYMVETRGRRSLVLDLKLAPDRETALRLAAKADVLLEGLRPGVMERLGVGPDVALARNPRLVYGRMTGWGQTGPYAQAARPRHQLHRDHRGAACDRHRRSGRCRR